MIFDKTLTVLGAGLSARRHTQAVTAGNVANADTPGYRARRVDFRQTLERVAQEGLPHGGGVDPLTGVDPLAARLEAVTTVDKSPGRADGNNVNMEAEISAQVHNALEFQALSTVMRRKFGMMRYALDQG